MGQIKKQQQYLLQNMRLKLNVVGIANSKKMLVNDQGIDLNNWTGLLDAATDLNMDKYIDTIRTKNLRNTVFADVTANDSVAKDIAVAFLSAPSIFRQHCQHLQ